MPGTGDLRLPVVVRSIESYRSTLQKGGFMYEELEVYPTQHVLNLKAGLRNIGKLPLALIYGCRKASNK